MKPTDDVWIPTTYVARPVYHATDHDRSDLVIAHRGHIAGVAGWALSRCGKPMTYLTYDDAKQRFFLSGQIGIRVPVRLINLAVARPCRRCWPRA